MKIDISHLKFDERGLIPAIVQDVTTDKVLMLAYMNGQSLARTVETGYTWFWSRSRQELWNKGAIIVCDVTEFCSCRVFLRVGCVDAVYAGTFQHYVCFDFDAAQ